MKNRKSNWIWIFAFIAIPVVGWPKGDENDRILARTSRDISLYYRWIPGPDSVKIREMQMEFEVNAPVADIISRFACAESYSQWAAGLKECRILQSDDSTWITYTLMDYPWPFKNRDMVTRYCLSGSGKTTIMNVNAVPDLISEKQGVERLRNYRGNWLFTPGREGKTSVKYTVVSYEKPLFPGFIQDPVIQNMMMDSLNDLRILAEKND